MKLIVLGNNGPYPKAGGACSGYLIEKDNTKILIDCGNGVLSRLQQMCDIEKIDAIILSHLHSDHMCDILVFKYALGIKKMKGSFQGSLPIYTPVDDEELINRFDYNGVFKIIPIEDEKILEIGDLKIEFKEMIHPVKTYAIKIKDGKKVFVYSGDTSYNDELIEFASEADFFLCEAGVLEEDRGETTPHLSAKQAGEVGSKAKVKRLILTHFWPEYRLDKIMNEAKESYDSILELSEEMKIYFI